MTVQPYVVMQGVRQGRIPPGFMSQRNAARPTGCDSERLRAAARKAARRDRARRGRVSDILAASRRRASARGAQQAPRRGFSSVAASLDGCSRGRRRSSRTAETPGVGAGAHSNVLLADAGGRPAPGGLISPSALVRIPRGLNCLPRGGTGGTPCGHYRRWWHGGARPLWRCGSRASSRRSTSSTGRAAEHRGSA